jgi:cytochrome c553
MLCPVAVAQVQPTKRAPDTMEARPRACEPCHGRQGGGTKNDYFPRLAGKPAGYLMNQLVAFRDGRRRYPPMNYLLEYLPDVYLQKIAEYFAALRPLPVQNAQTDVSEALLARGRSLVTDGAQARGVPGMLRMSRPQIDRDGTWHSGPRGASPELY